MTTYIEKLREFDDFLIFERKVRNAKDNLNLVRYYNRILSDLLSDDRKSILNKNKDMILSNIDNLLETIDRVKEFVEEEL